MRKIVIPLFFAGMVCGCATTTPVQNSDRLPFDIPNEWRQADQQAMSVSQGWIATFDDSDLSALVDEALQGNFNLAVTAARVRSAQAQAAIAGAPRWPQISAGLDAARSKRSSASGVQIASPISNQFQLGADISWELDIWGRLTNQARAAALQAAATESDFNAARFSLAANVARAWFNAIEAQQQRALAQRSADNYVENIAVVEDGVIAGLSTALDLRLLRSQAANAYSQLAVRERQATVAVRALEILLGRYPASALPIAAALPTLATPPPTGLPSTLIERRPDLIASRARLLAQEQNLNAAQKNLLPSLRLTGSGGTSTARFSDLLNLDFLIWNIVGNLTAPIFQGGRLKAEREQANAELDAQAADYAATALNAFLEVENALEAEQWLDQQLRALSRATEESIEAERLAEESYASGLVDVVTLLEAQRRAVDAQSGLIALRTQRLQNRIDLHLALGGDFEARQTPSQSSQIGQDSQQ